MRILAWFLASTWSGLVAAMGVGFLLTWPGVLPEKSTANKMAAHNSWEITARLADLREEVRALRREMPSLLAQAAWLKESEVPRVPPDSQSPASETSGIVLEGLSDGLAVVRDGNATHQVRVGDLIHGEKVLLIDTDAGVVRTTRHSFALGE